MLLEAVVRPRSKPVKVPSLSGDADHGRIQMAAFHHGLQRRKNLLVGKIARGSEEDQGIGLGIAHSLFLSEATCPLLSPSDRRTRSASQTAPDSENPPRRAS